MTSRTTLGIWLTAVWVLLWGGLQPLVLVSGFVVAAGAVAVSRLPSVPGQAVVRWRRLPRTLARFALDLVSSAAQVGRAVLRSGRATRATRAAVIAVGLPSLSDLVVTAVCQRISLVPGTVVVDVDRDRDVIYVYVMDVDEDSVERHRRNVRRQALDVVRVLAIDAPREDP